MNTYSPNTFRLCGGFSRPAKLAGIPVVREEEGGALPGNTVQVLECGCVLEWYPHSLRSVDSCLIHAGYIVLDELEFIQSISTTERPSSALANLPGWAIKLWEENEYTDGVEGGVHWFSFEREIKIPKGANVCDWFRKYSQPDDTELIFPVWEYLGADADGIGIKWLIKGHRYCVI